MKNTHIFAPRLLVATVALCALGFAQTVYAQTEAPTPKVGKNGKRAGNAGKKHGKNLTPRVIKAIEDQTGKPLTPEVKDQLTTALHAREAAVKAANETYYAAMAQATGLTVDQAKAIDKPTGKAKLKTADAAMAPAAPATPAAKPLAAGAQ